LGQVQQAHAESMAATAHAISAGPSAPPPYSPMPAAPGGHSLYPSLDEYMGLSSQHMQENMAVVVASQDKQIAQLDSPCNRMVAPVTGSSNLGLMRAQIKDGIRHIVMCKDAKGKMGLRVRDINKGIFVAFVHKDSPAALAGLRFGDQILQINGETVAGWDTDKAMKFLNKCDPKTISMAIRDRPFERTITMQKDSMGHIGFVFKDGKITAIVKDSSAARNGVLTEHQLVEVNGQNVVGLKNKEIAQIIDSVGNTVTITILPSFLYDHMIKSMGSSLIKKLMDHSIPDL